MAGDRLEGEEKLIILVVFLLTWLDLFENDEVERRVSSFFFFLKDFTYLFLAAQGVYCYVGFSLVAVSRGCSLAAVCGSPAVVPPAEPGSRACGCQFRHVGSGSRAQAQ